jgi:hypothetical protein
MADNNDNDINIFLDDICEEPDPDISIGTPASTRVYRSNILNVDSDFMSGVSREAEKSLKKDQDAILMPPISTTSRNIIANNPDGVMNINIQPGSSLNKALANPTQNDSLIAAIRDNQSSNMVLRAIMAEIAEEAAYLKAWRNENWGNGEDISDATFKRIKMLKHLVETIVEHEKLKKDSVSGKVDFHGEAFQRVLKYFLETLQTTFHKINIPVQYEDIFFTELAKAFDGFEKSAERIYYGKE